MPEPGNAPLAVEGTAGVNEITSSVRLVRKAVKSSEAVAGMAAPDSRLDRVLGGPSTGLILPE